MESVRRIRKEHGWSQEKTADEAGINKVTLVHIETGKTSPNVETLQKLANAFGVEVADFFPKAQAPLPFDESAVPQRLSLDEVKDRFAPLAEGLNRYCERWEEKIPILKGSPEEVIDFILDLQDFRGILDNAYVDELYAVATALGFVSVEHPYGALPEDMATGFMRAETEQHSLVHAALQRLYRVGFELAESTGDEELAGQMQHLAHAEGAA